MVCACVQGGERRGVYEQTLFHFPIVLNPSKVYQLTI